MTRWHFILLPVLAVLGFLFGEVVRKNAEPDLPRSSNSIRRVGASDLGATPRTASPPFQFKGSLAETLRANPNDKTFRQLLELAHTLRPLQQAMAAKVILHRWLLVRPEEALSYSKMDGSRSLTPLFAAWSQLPDPMPGWQAARRNTEFMRPFVEAVARKNARLAWDLITSDKKPNDWTESRAHASIKVLERLAETDPKFCLEILKTHERTWIIRFWHSAHESLAKAFLKTDPDLAITLTEPPSLFRYWFLTDPKAAEDYFNNLATESPLRKKLVAKFSVASELLTQSDIAQQIQSDTNPFYLSRRDFSRREFRPSPQQLIDLAAGDLEKQNLISDWWKQDDSPDEAFLWASQIPEQKAREAALTSWAVSWSEHQPDRVMKFLDQLPASRLLVELVGFVRFRSPGHPVTISDGMAEKLKVALESFIEEDRERLLKNSPGISAGMIRILPTKMAQLFNEATLTDDELQAIADKLRIRPHILRAPRDSTFFGALEDNPRHRIIRFLNRKTIPDDDDEILYLQHIDDPLLVSQILMRHLKDGVSGFYLRDMIDSHPALSEEQRSDLLEEMDYQETVKLR